MNQAETLCHRPNSAIRNLCLRPVHHSSLKFDHSSAPLSPQTPSLPVPRPANDATREKQIPFRKAIEAIAEDIEKVFEGLCPEVGNFEGIEIITLPEIIIFLDEWPGENGPVDHIQFPDGPKTP